MMQSSRHSLQQLCESWRQQLASLTKEKQCVFAEKFLEWFGWTAPSPLAFPGDASQAPGVSYLLQQRGHGVVAAHFVLPGALKPPAALLERGLDFCEITRALVTATRAIKVRYAFISDLYRAYLYDAVDEDLLVTADTPANIDSEFGSILQRDRVVDGSLDDIRRHPRSYLARQYREWRGRWCAALIQEWQATEAQAALAMDRLVLLRYMAERNALVRTGWQFRRQCTDLIRIARTAQAGGVGHTLVSLYRDVWKHWDAELYAPEAHLDSILEQDAVAGPLLREFALLSRAKFQLATILESFNYGDAAEKARVRMIPEENEERLAALAKQTVESIDGFRIELDLIDEGYRAVLYWFDQLTGLYARLARENQNQPQPFGRPAGHEGPDLFEWSQADAGRPAALRDPFHHAFERGLVVYYATEHQARVVRLLFYLHVIDRYTNARQRIMRFPPIESALHKRPRMLDTDRKLIFRQAAASDEWEAI